jgi:hypothetical protein
MYSFSKRVQPTVDNSEKMGRKTLGAAHQEHVQQLLFLEEQKIPRLLLNLMVRLCVDVVRMYASDWSSLQAVWLAESRKFHG